MKFQGARQTLLEGFATASGVVAARAVKPVLQNVRLSVVGRQAILEATDLEVALRQRVDLLEVEEEGSILVPPGRMTSVLREAKGADVYARLDDGTLVLRCGRGNFKIRGEDAVDFPDWAPFPEEKAFRLMRDQLRILIKKTIFATAREKTRYAFNGVRLEIEGDAVRMIATDGKRMAVMAFPVANPDGITAGVIIPTKALSTVEKILSPDEPEVAIAIQDKQIQFRSGATEISSRLIEGAFPRYQAVIPSTFIAEGRFPREELLSSLRQASTLTNEESRSVKIALDDQALTLRSRSMDVGEAEITLPVELVGEAIESSFNADYMIDGLKAMDVEAITLRMSGRDTPAQLAGEEHYTYIVMPITLRSG